MLVEFMGKKTRSMINESLSDENKYINNSLAKCTDSCMSNWVCLLDIREVICCRTSALPQM